MYEKMIKELDIKLCENADIEWLDFVLMCCEKGELSHDYDFVVVATVDDDTALCLKAYEEGLYGEKYQKD